MTAEPTQSVQDRGVLKGRYEIVGDIGRGGQARTYRARDLDNDQPVALKELDLSFAADWKAIELFEREGKVLDTLDHPNIPAYIDAFRLDAADGADRRFILVQQFVAGRSLQDCIDAGDLFGPDQGRRLLREIFDILDYLHSMTPPVVHRDIKPSNIIIRPDETLALVDFGAVQQILHSGVGGQTVVGTAGFIPPEQLMGRACPASDLYALGATVVYAMTGHDPAMLPVRKMRLQYKELIDWPASFYGVLDGLLEPVVDDRLATIDEARAAVEPADASAKYPTTARVMARRGYQPAPLDAVDDTRVQLSVGPRRLHLHIAPRRSRTMLTMALIAAAVGIGVVVGLPNGLWRVLGGFIILAGIIMPVDDWLRRTDLNISRQDFRIETQVMGQSSGVKGAIDQLDGVTEVSKRTILGRIQKCLVLSTGINEFEFGEDLDKNSQRYISERVEAFLEGPDQ